MLTHANLLYQVSNLHFFLRPQAGQRALSLLPPWHIYERSCGCVCATPKEAAGPQGTSPRGQGHLPLGPMQAFSMAGATHPHFSGRQQPGACPTALRHLAPPRCPACPTPQLLHSVLRRLFGLL